MRRPASSASFFPALFLCVLLFVLGFGLSAAPTYAQGRGGGSMWERLSGRDTNGDGKISRAEFPGPDRLFDRLDTDGDQHLTKAETQARRGNRGGGRNVDRLQERFDIDKNSAISREEWEKFFLSADKNGDHILDKEEFAAAVAGRPYRDAAPAAGTAIPAVSAKSRTSGKIVSLAKPRRLTVLVFGSWT